MAILKIAKMGHPILRGFSEEIPDPSASEIQRLIKDMLDTMADAEGMGLAAPQVYVPKRLVIFCVPQDSEDQTSITVLMNPIINPTSEDVAYDWEGCLSVPGLRGLVPRHTSISYSGVDQNGRKVDRVAEGLHARVVQHECDHLDGLLYPQRMDDLRNLVFNSEIKHQPSSYSSSTEV